MTSTTLLHELIQSLTWVNVNIINIIIIQEHKENTGRWNLFLPKKKKKIILLLLPGINDINIIVWSWVGN